MTFVRPDTTTVPNPRAWGYGVSFDDGTNKTYFQLTSPAAEIVTAPQQAPRVQTEQGAEDFRDDFGQTYSRSDLSGGEGLDFLHEPGRANAERRFWSSRGVNPFLDFPGAVYAVEMLPEMETLVAVGFGDNIEGKGIALLGDQAFVPSGTAWDGQGAGDHILVVDDITATTPVITYENPWHGGTVGNTSDIVELNGEVYVAANGSILGIKKRDSVGTWTQWSDFDGDFVWAIKDRIISTDLDGLLVEPQPGAGPHTTIKDTGSPEARFTQVGDLGLVIAAATLNGRIYFFEDQSGTLTEVGLYQLPATEIATAFVTVGDIVFMATIETVDEPAAIYGRTRVYTASLSQQAGNYTLADLQVVWELEPRDNVTPYPASQANRFTITDFEATGDSVYWGIGINTVNGSFPTENERVQLFRYFLPTGGVAQWLEFVGNDLAVGFLNSGTRPVVTPAQTLIVCTGGIFRKRPDGRVVATGYLIGPAADFFTASPKQWTEARLVFQQTLNNTDVLELSYSTDPEALLDAAHSSWVEAIDAAPVTQPGYSADGSYEEVVKTLSGVTGRWLMAKVDFARIPAGIQGPKLRSFSFRAFPPAEQDRIVRLRVNVSDHIEAPNRKPIHAKGFGSYMYGLLQEYEGQDVTLELLEPGLTVVGQVTSIESPIQEVSERGSTTLVSVVEVRGRVA